jgi:hypothetical protein
VARLGAKILGVEIHGTEAVRPNTRIRQSVVPVCGYACVWPSSNRRCRQLACERCLCVQCACMPHTRVHVTSNQGRFKKQSMQPFTVLTFRHRRRLVIAMVQSPACCGVGMQLGATYRSVELGNHVSSTLSLICCHLVERRCQDSRCRDVLPRRHDPQRRNQIFPEGAYL